VRTHLLFALTAIAAGGNAISESFVYQATTVEAMAIALKWYVAFSGLWAISLLWFIVAYGRAGSMGWLLAIFVSAELAVAMAINVMAPYSFIYTEILELREIALPWGETTSHAVGRHRTLPLVAEFSMLAAFGVVISSCLRLWRDGLKSRAWVFGMSIVLFMFLFATHATLVDMGILDPPYLSTYGFLAVVLVISYDMAGDVVRASLLSQELKQRDADLRAAIDEERSRIASDLHDSVTQTLFSTAAIADALPDVWDRFPDEARNGLEQLRQLTKGALAEMRNLLLELHPSALLEKELGTLLQQLADGTAARTHVPVTVQSEGDQVFPNQVQIALYRIAQESLNNAVKHAQASAVTLSLISTADRTELAISDDGQGFDPLNVRPGRLGVEIMRERARSVCAGFSIESLPGKGTTVRVVWQPETSE
jgi:signal transduction histidine kinase